MECPVCGSESSTTLKSKKISSKSKDINELLLKCNSCNFVFRDTITEDKPSKFRLIISEHEKSIKTLIELYPDEKLETGNSLLSDIGQAEITSLETKQGKRVESAVAKDISTIWASSLEIPARVGISVDFSGKADSYKVDVERDFKFSVDDVVKINDSIFKIKSIKTLKRLTKKGFAKASVIKRVYGIPVNLNSYDYDLTNKIISKKLIKK
ncbi:MAG: hypothetical protein LBU74_01190 [Methanobacteriaceae archaeon]|jgi:uncharacterized Zn finger protein|nr:hypothetical protein [Candidatus Methanorudis spinitermitis]